MTENRGETRPGGGHVDQPGGAQAERGEQPAPASPGDGPNHGTEGHGPRNRREQEGRSEKWRQVFGRRHRRSK